MNKMNRVSLVIGMLAVLVGIFSSAVLAEQMNGESTVDSTVTRVAHWQAMNPDFSDSTLTRVAHWKAMNPDLSESTVTQVVHWQAMNPDFSESTVTQVAHWQAMNPDLSESTVTQVAHWRAMSEVFRVHELAIIDRDVVADASVDR